MIKYFKEIDENTKLTTVYYSLDERFGLGWEEEVVCVTGKRKPQKCHKRDS